MVFDFSEPFTASDKPAIARQGCPSWYQTPTETEHPSLWRPDSCRARRGGAWVRIAFYVFVKEMNSVLLLHCSGTALLQNPKRERIADRLLSSQYSLYGSDETLLCGLTCLSRSSARGVMKTGCPFHHPRFQKPSRLGDFLSWA